MIETTLYYALACNTAFMFPWYQRLTSARHTTPKDDDGNFINSKRYQSNPLHRKPFVCLYCLTFWVTIIGALFIPLVLGQAVTPRESIAPAVCAPFLAELLNRFFKSLPITL